MVNTRLWVRASEACQASAFAPRSSYPRTTPGHPDAILEQPEGIHWPKTFAVFWCFLGCMLSNSVGSTVPFQGFAIPCHVWDVGYGVARECFGSETLDPNIKERSQTHSSPEWVDLPDAFEFLDVSSMTSSMPRAIGSCEYLSPSCCTPGFVFSYIWFRCVALGHLGNLGTETLRRIPHLVGTGSWAVKCVSTCAEHPAPASHGAPWHLGWFLGCPMLPCILKLVDLGSLTPQIHNYSVTITIIPWNLRHRLAKRLRSQLPDNIRQPCQSSFVMFCVSGGRLWALAWVFCWKLRCSFSPKDAQLPKVSFLSCKMRSQNALGLNVLLTFLLKQTGLDS